MADLDAISERIAKLLATADDPSLSEEARDSYRDKAIALMAKYGVEAAQQKTNDSEKIRLAYVLFPGVGKIYTLHVARMAATIARAFNVHATYVYSKNECMILLSLFEGDAERIISLIKFIVAQSLMAHKSWSTNYETRAQLKGMTAAQKYRLRYSFFIGYGMRVADRITALYSDAVAESPGTEIALRSEYGRLEAYMAEHVNIERSRSLKYSVSGANAGDDAGRKALIGQVEVNERSSRLSIEA